MSASNIGYNARIVRLDERRPGFSSVIDAVIELERRTKAFPPDLAARVQEELDAGTPCSSIVAMIEATG